MNTVYNYMFILMSKYIEQLDAPFYLNKLHAYSYRVRGSTKIIIDGIGSVLTDRRLLIATGH